MIKKEYDYKEIIDGITAFIPNIKDGGQEITVSGWRDDHYKYKKGQRIVFILKDGRETRYRIKSIKHMDDPSDQYFMDCIFDPRL